jgi:glycosyltransferase involved in cell wall biosynthesis
MILKVLNCCSGALSCIEVIMADQSGKLSISVVICAYNEQDWIAHTLASLLEQKRPADEIIIVNNASTDNTEAVLQRFIAEHSGSPISVVYESKKGLHHAREAGWRAAHSDIVVNTDADITFPRDWLQLVEKSFEDPEVAAITGILRYNDALPIINWVTWACDQVFQPEGVGRWMTKEYVLTGGNSAYRRSVLEVVNGYLGKPEGILEDRYMSAQIQERGYKIKFVRKLKVWHTFRRFNKEGWRGYLKYMFFYTPENVYPDHLADA